MSRQFITPYWGYLSAQEDGKTYILPSFGYFIDSSAATYTLAAGEASFTVIGVSCSPIKGFYLLLTTTGYSLVGITAIFLVYSGMESMLNDKNGSGTLCLPAKFLRNRF